ncbi:hypothetical protein TNCV_4309401 [Trichonephila clavipes]|nr:hypothetical protein TNCV_4309401 [Trichonephila clavipes]
MLRAYGTENRGFCPPDKRATLLMSLAELRKRNLLNCRGAIYPQKEQPKNSSDSLDRAKSLDSIDELLFHSPKKQQQLTRSP